MAVAYKKEQYADVDIDELQPADILLVHTRRSFWGWLIRFGTHCYWNHAMMIYSKCETGRDYDDTLVIDPNTDGSIVLRKLSYYLSRPDKYDIAVKRLENGQFDYDDLTRIRKLICSIAVNEVQTELSMRLIRLKNKIVRQFTVIWRFIRRKLHKTCRQPGFSWNVRPFEVRAFTCGGFVQWCYYMGVLKSMKESQVYGGYDGDVIFNSRIKEVPTPFELLTTTPADLANCEKLSWVYTVINGVKYSHIRGLYG